MKRINIIKKYFKPIKTIPKSYGFFLFAGVFDVFSSIFLVQLGFYIIQAVEEGNKDTLVFRGIVLGISFLIKHLINLGNDVVNDYMWNQLYFEIKKSCFKRFIRLDNNKIESIGIGKVQNLISTGVSARSNMITRTFASILMEILGIVYAFILIIMKSPTIYHFLALLGIFLLSSGLMMKGLYTLEGVRKESKDIQLDISRMDIKVMMSKMEVLQNNKIESELSSQQLLVNKSIALRQKGNLIKGLWQICGFVLVNGLQLRIYVGVGVGVITGNYTFAYMMLLLQLINIVDQNIWQLRNHFKQYFDEKTQVEKLREVFDGTPTIKGYDEGENFMYTTGDITIENLFYGYHSDKDEVVFSDFCLTIQGGKKTALVGISGSGKSTLVKLIAGYLTPTSGSIIVNGQSLQNVSLKSYYNHIGYLTQDPSVFDGSIRENLTYAIKHTVSDTELKTMIEHAKCEFIYSLPNGLDTEIGERGIRLSGGQRQRLAIAKIMLKNPNIILLDEPTSALDSFSEESITEAMHNLFKKRTVIVIAHRLQTVKNADDIIVLHQGKVIERGTHEGLVQKGGEYAKMLELQSGF